MKLKKEEILDLMKFGFTLIEEYEPIERKKINYLINYSGKPHCQYMIFNLDKRVLPAIKQMTTKKYHDNYKYHYTFNNNNNINVIDDSGNLKTISIEQFKVELEKLATQVNEINNAAINSKIN